jgi:hypothetical protein
MSSSTSTSSSSGIAGSLAGSHGIALTVSGIPVPIYTKPGIHLQTVERVNQILPTLFFHMLDFYGLYSNAQVPINDGTQLTLAFNDGNSGLPAAYNYRAYGTPIRKKHPAGYDELLVYATLDNLPYTREAANRALTGSSTSVVGQIASLLNMGYTTNDSSQDSMTWLSGRASWAKYVSNIEKYAYSNSQSMFAHAVTGANNLLFMNIQKLMAGKNYVATLYYGVQPPSGANEPSYQLYDYKIVSSSGFLNHLFAYGMRQSQTGSTGSVTINNTVDATYTTGENIDINANSAQRLSNRSRIQVAPVDCGNTHANYYPAKHQNARLKATYSQMLVGMSAFYTGLNVFDIVRVIVYNQGVQNSTASGTYFVSAIQRGICGTRYFERMELMSTGPANQTNALVS